MGRGRIKTKDFRYLNVSIESSIHDEFNEFCKEFGMSKTGATEKALVMYMKKFRDAMKLDLGEN